MKVIKAMSLASVAVIATGAHAQGLPADNANSANVEDIVVTATRTQSFASKTPIALTAVTGDQLLSKGVSNPTQLTDTVPNLSIVRGNGLQITIRGVTSTDGTEKGDPSAAFLLDGIYIARPQAQEVSFYDIERVEVLRGPQGTLYGRNTTAGVVNVLSATPKFDFGGSADVMYESFNHALATAVINVPVGEKIALRAAINYDRRDNYIIKNTSDPYKIDPFKNNLSTRLSALFQPTDDLKILVRGDYSWIKGRPLNSVPGTNFFTPSSFLAGTSPIIGATPSYSGGSAKAERTTTFPELWQGYRDNRERGVMGQLDWKMSNAFTLTYLGSYRKSDRNEHSTIIAGQNRATFAGHYWQNSQELRLAYNSGPLQAQAGGYYFKEKSGIAFFILDPQNLGFPPFATQFGFPQDPTIATSKAAFGQATFAITPALKITGGVRYSHDDKSRVGATVFDTLPSAGIPGNRVYLQHNDAKRSFAKTTWRVGVDYDVPDLGLVYATVSTGYKAGGFNDGCETGKGAGCALPASALYYAPETLTAYESGFKFRFSSAFRLNGSIFHYDYQGLQLSSVTNACGGPCQITSNAGKAKVDGVELEAVLKPAAHHQFDLSANYLKARYTQFKPVPTVDFAGRPLSRSPKWTWTAGYTFDHPLANGGSLVANARLRFSSGYDLTDLANRIFFYQPSYTKSDASLTYQAPGDRYTIGVFVKNLENNLVLTSVGASNQSSATFEDPRTIGVRVGVKF